MPEKEWVSENEKWLGEGYIQQVVVVVVVELVVSPFLDVPATSLGQDSGGGLVLLCSCREIQKLPNLLHYWVVLTVR